MSCVERCGHVAHGRRGVNMFERRRTSRARETDVVDIPTQSTFRASSYKIRGGTTDATHETRIGAGDVGKSSKTRLETYLRS